MKWDPDKRVENLLKKKGIPWTVKEVSFSDIDWNSSKNNFARIEDAVNLETVTRYRVAIESGDYLPMPVLFDLCTKDKTQYSLAGGFQRCQAALAVGIDTVTSYVIPATDEAVVELLPCKLNVIEGRGATNVDAIETAKKAVRQFKYTVNDAAEEYGLTSTKLHEELSLDDRRERLLLSGVTKADKLLKAHLKNLGPVSSNDNVLAEAGRFATMNSSISSRDVHECVRDAVKATTEAGQIRRIKEFSDRYSPRKSPPQYKKRSHFFRSLSNLENTINGTKTPSDLQLFTDEDKREAWKRLGNLIRLLRTLSAMCEENIK